MLNTWSSSVTKIKVGPDGKVTKETTTTDQSGTHTTTEITDDSDLAGASVFGSNLMLDQMQKDMTDIDNFISQMMSEMSRSKPKRQHQAILPMRILPIIEPTTAPSTLASELQEIEDFHNSAPQSEVVIEALKAREHESLTKSTGLDNTYSVMSKCFICLVMFGIFVAAVMLTKKMILQNDQ